MTDIWHNHVNTYRLIITFTFIYIYISFKLQHETSNPYHDPFHTNPYFSHNPYHK